MTITGIKRSETEREKLERQLRGFEGIQSWMLESDEKAELRRIRERLTELDTGSITSIKK